MTLEKAFKFLIRSKLSLLFFPFMFFYFLILKIKKMTLSAGFQIPGLKVISIGNLDFGGTGKTPTLLRLLEEVKSCKTSVITRGYKSKLEHLGSTLVDPNTQNKADLIGDEPSLILTKYPDIILCVGKDRKKGLSLAKSKNASLAFLDDGAQQIKIKKDLNILLLDPKEPLKKLFPLGLRRDDLMPLANADFVIFPYVALSSDYEIACDTIRNKTNAKTIGLKANLEISSLNKNLSVLTAIANPERFLEGLKNLGFQILSQKTLADHATFDESTLEAICKNAEKKHLQCVCTEKDWMKLPKSYKQKFYPVKLTLEPAFDLPNWQSLVGKIQKMS